MDVAKDTSASRAKQWRAKLYGDPVRLAGYRAKTRAASKARYDAFKGNPEFVAKERERKRELQRKRRANPETKAIIKAQDAIARQKPSRVAKRAASMAAWRAANKDAVRGYQTHWKEENAEAVQAYGKSYGKQYREIPEKRAAIRANQLSKNYGLTIGEFNSFWRAQNGKCAICAVEMVAAGREKNSACVDHNHETGEVRGLLCRPCNHGIGCLNDSPEVLDRAAVYLRDRGYYGKSLRK